MSKRRGSGSGTRRLFMESEQMEMLDKTPEQIALESRPVECLGMTFESDDARRAYFLKKLREKLRDPEFRKIEGFPIGSGENILRLSDPPYYTACPNPFISDFIEHCGKPYDPVTDDYQREPFAADVSEGKYDPFYKLHAYPTKVPYKAIMRYILHYTEPGDVVFDGFAGTGMTGLAGLMCGDRRIVEELGEDIGESQVGFRYSVLADISTNATHIASGYTTPIDTQPLARYVDQCISRIQADLGWMYKTIDPDSGQECNVDYVVWSEVFICDNCGREFSYWAAAVSYSPGDDLGEVSADLTCPHCGAVSSRRSLNNATVAVLDQVIGKPVTVKKQVPVLVNYTLGSYRKEKLPDAQDLSVLQRIDSLPIADEVSSELLMHTGMDWGDLQREYHFGITHSHQFFTKRNLTMVSALFSALHSIPEPYRDAVRFLITATFNRITKLVRYMPQYKERNVGPLSGTLYIPMLFGEINPLKVLAAKTSRTIAGLSLLPYVRTCVVTTQSSAAISTQMAANAIDYIFTDPPFGNNLPYAELNFNEETWLGVMTNTQAEAIVSESRKVALHDYQTLIQECFSSNYRVLKPGRWMTVVFHNSSNAVWNAIQEAIHEAGFVTADVRTLDKKRGTTKQQVYTSGAVKQDLIISAYKPTAGFEERFMLEAGTDEGAWDFVRSHLGKLPVFVSKDGRAEIIAERQNYLLFDRMVAFHVQRLVMVPLSASEFYSGLEQRFPVRDEMYFLTDQVAEYDRKRMTVSEVLQLDLFVTDESSAIQWLRQQLTRKPRTFQEIHPLFIREIGGWAKHEKTLELSELLEQNFLRYDGKGAVPSQIHSYLSTDFREMRNLSKDDPDLQSKAKDRWYVPDPNKAGDLEKLRERTLLREFDDYRQSAQRKLKVFRLEAVRAGFRKAWQDRDYQTIIDVANKIPDDVLQEDPKLLMWYDQAITRMGGAQ